ncbi:MAG: YajQ family cyclic di-GMP-binding protein [Longimicrobiales bacterium]|nr:YajQ family cyclic di-GMP-binding protein [Longimicrobiales bacterium]
MAKTSSFDISTGVDLQEVDNAVNQAMKEVATRYDFRGTNCTIEFERADAAIQLDADDDYKLTALLQILRERMVRRGVPVKNLDEGKVEHGSLGRVRQRIGLKQGIDQETAKRISKAVRDQPFKKVQVQIQGDELRVTAPSRDTLQEVIAFLKGEDFGVELEFGNYR